MALCLEEADGVDAAFIKIECRVVFLLCGWVNIAFERELAFGLRVTAAEIDRLFAVHKDPNVIIAIEIQRRRIAIILKVCLDMRREVEIIGISVCIAVAARIIGQREITSVFISVHARSLVLACELK